MADQLILSDPEIMGGAPCIAGTRLTVYAVRARIRSGESVAELLAGYPTEVTGERVQAAIDYADRVPFASAACIGWGLWTKEPCANLTFPA